MADIQFDEEQQLQRQGQVEERPFFIRLVLATGIVSTDRQAEYVLLGLAVVLIILAFIIPSFIGGTGGRIPQNIPQKLTNAPASPNSLNQSS